MNDKPRVIKDYEKLPLEIQEQIKISNPHGYHKKLITFTDARGAKVSALPFETDEKYYLVRMTVAEARQIVAEDEDFDDEGSLKEERQDVYEERYEDLDYLELESETDEDEDDDDE
jgi:hypothetical protein